MVQQNYSQHLEKKKEKVDIEENVLGIGIVVENGMEIFEKKVEDHYLVFFKADDDVVNEVVSNVFEKERKLFDEKVEHYKKNDVIHLDVKIGIDFKVNVLNEKVKLQDEVI